VHDLIFGQRGESSGLDRQGVDDAYEAVCLVDIRARLAADRERTVAQIASLGADLADIMTSAELVATDDEHDPEGATIAFERSRVAALLTQSRDHLVAIDHAETRLVDGTYGRCETCGQPISHERLDARPSAADCIDCATGTVRP
jgi:DnaK suppressor protein